MVGLLFASSYPWGSALAQPAYLVRDLRTAPEEESSAPGGFLELDGLYYFSARTPERGWELWSTDVTAEGTRLVADICPGRCSAGSWPLAVAGGRLYFRADDGSSGRELWSVAPGEEPVRARDVCPGTCSPILGSVAELAGRLFFRADDGASGSELWTSDGTPEGTNLVRDLCEGACSSDPDELTTFGEHLYFAASGNEHGRELWRTDGTAEGTQLVADLCPDCDASPAAITVLEDRLYFAANDGERGREPWVSDGSARGTVLVADLLPGTLSSDPQAFHQLLGRLYILSEACNCAWKRQGEGFVFASELFPGGRARRPFELLEIGGQILFTAGRDFLSSGDQLWASDGTALGTRLVLQAIVSIDGLTPTEHGLVFQANSINGGSELWFSDGSPAGTVSLGDLRPGVLGSFPRSFVQALGGALFAATAGRGRRELWFTDGTADGTEELHDLAAPVASSNPELLLPFRNQVLLRASQSGFRDSIWIANGLPGGTVELARGYSDDLVLAGGRVLFHDGFHLQSSNGTPQGTQVLVEAPEGLRQLAALRPGAPDASVLYGDFDQGQKLWRLGVASGEATLIADLNPEWSNQGCFFDPCIDPPKLPTALTSVGKAVFFLASQEGTPIQLWITKGESGSTHRLRTFATGQILVPDFFAQHGEDLFPNRLTPFGQGVLFSAFEKKRGREPWWSDGTPTGTRRLGDLVPGAGSSLPRAFTVQGREAFFFAQTAGSGDSLWRTDGTKQGTRVVSDLLLDGLPVHGVEMVSVAGKLYFSAFSDATGQELWTSDGTLAGTRLLADLRPGPLGSSPSDLTAVGDRLLFAADDGRAGKEIWVSDGQTLARVEDLAPGLAPSSPEAFTVAGRRVFFSADDGRRGRELWALSVEAINGDPCTSNTRLCLRQDRFEVTVDWQNPRNGAAGAGRPVDGTDETGYFRFFQPENLELVVKILDGRHVNGHFWVFAGALTDLAYQLRVTDHQTSQTRVYESPGGDLCGTADTSAFPSDTTGGPASAPASLQGASSSHQGLDLGNGRFHLDVSWHDPRTGATGDGRGVFLTEETGAFWFFSSQNLELLVKVLDGRQKNGHFWVLYGALTDLEYRITVTDNETGAQRVYENTSRDLCGGADIEAF